jgi:hypothetical protein
MKSIPITWCSHHYSWKYGERYLVMCCVGFAPNITLCIQDKKWIALPNCHYYFIALLQTWWMFRNVLFCTGILIFTLSVRFLILISYLTFILLGKSVKNKFLFTADSDQTLTGTTLGQLCIAQWDSQSRQDPGINPGSVVMPLALRCRALDRCTTREPIG